MNFSQILTELKAGEKVYRPSWLGARKWVAMNKDRNHFFAYFPPREGYPGGQNIGHTMSSADIMADDWAVYKEEGKS